MILDIKIILPIFKIPFYSSKSIKPGNIKTKKMMKRLTDFCMQELYDIDVCRECYRNANTNEHDWFSMVCCSPHILVWARVTGDRGHFPAKAMAIKKMANKTLIHVQFFGTKTRNAFVELNACYLFSKVGPRGVQFDIGQAPRVRIRFLKPLLCS